MWLGPTRILMYFYNYCLCQRNNVHLLCFVWSMKKYLIKLIKYRIIWKSPFISTFFGVKVQFIWARNTLNITVTSGYEAINERSARMDITGLYPRYIRRYSDMGWTIAEYHRSTTATCTHAAAYHRCTSYIGSLRFCDPPRQPLWQSTAGYNPVITWLYPHENLDVYVTPIYVGSMVM